MDDDGLVFSCHDEEGVIEVVDDLDTRALYFGTSARQSAMSPEEPHRLVLSYTRAMLSGLLFTRQPRSALVLGLGGGSLPRFLMHVFPTCRIDVVERRAKVVQVAP
jgi:spermidine synthase